jgi:hypothetical protein
MQTTRKMSTVSDNICETEQSGRSTEGEDSKVLKLVLEYKQTTEALRQLDPPSKESDQFNVKFIVLDSFRTT